MSSANGFETLSNRAAKHANEIDYWAIISKALANSWSPTNQAGVVVLGIAQNELIHDTVKKHIQDHLVVDPGRHFTYGDGPGGSLLLRNALAGFFNDYFKPVVATKPAEFLALAGVAAVVESLTWAICDEGEGILFPQPLYTGFNGDVTDRPLSRVVPVSFRRSDGTFNHDDVLDAEANVASLERAFERSTKAGIRVKAVMINNPHNPLGKCYPVDTIRAVAGFCAKHNLHYLSDEIYALSQFENAAFPHAQKFVSVLSVDLKDIIRPELVHVLYGAAKDFGLPGFRLGVLHTRNEALRSAVLSVMSSSWVPYVIQDIWARMLADKPFVQNLVALNRTLLATHYNIITDFFNQHNIPYLRGSNAAIFIWADFRERLLPGGKDEDFASGSRFAKVLTARQNLLNDHCQRKGVWIGKGQSFTPEEIGWFRIVFTVKEETLKIGLNRIVEALAELEGSGQLSHISSAL